MEGVEGRGARGEHGQGEVYRKRNMRKQERLTHGSRVLRVPGALALDPLQELTARQLLHQEDAHDIGTSVFRGPGDGELVGDRRRQLAQGGDVHRLAGPLGLHARLVCRQWVLVGEGRRESERSVRSHSDRMKE